MSRISKGSTPGLLAQDNTIYPSLHPTTSPETAKQSCKPLQSRNSDCQAEDNAKAAIEDIESVPTSPTTVDEKHGDIYPEGGLRAWLCVLGSFSGMTAGFGFMNSVGTYQAYLAGHQLSGYAESSVAWIFSVYIFLSFFCGVQIGPIFDAHGPRWLVASGSVMLLLSIFLLAECTQYWHFMLVFGVVGGIGTSLVFTPAISSLGHFFLKKRANATGIAAAGGSVGGVVFPLMLPPLFESVGWAWAMRIQGFIFVFLLIIANLTIRSRLPPKPGGSVLPDFKIFRDPSFALVTVGTYFLEWGLFSPIAYLPSYALSTNAMSETFAFQIIAIFNAASCIGRWIPGYIADRLGRYNTMIATIILCMLASFTFWLPSSLIAISPERSDNTIVGLLIVFCVIMGFGSGSNISLTPVCVSMLCDTEEYGRYYATCYTLVSFGTLTGLPLCGGIVAASDGAYYGVALFTGLCYVGAFLCFGAVRVIKVGWKVTSMY